MNDLEVYEYFVFPSMITEVVCEDYQSIRDDLISWIYDYQSHTEGVHVSNRGGWQSPDDFYFQESFSPFLNYLCKYIDIACGRYLVDFAIDNMWINVNSKGNYNTSHTHPGAILSGVFWISVPDNSGRLSFENPNDHTQHSLFDIVDPEIKESFNIFPTYYFTPSEGRLVVFPPDLRHHVEQNQSDSNRISIAFNLKFDKRTDDEV
jgi:uncharacterized protein (TIGR02466 family)